MVAVREALAGEQRAGEGGCGRARAGILGDAEPARQHAGAYRARGITVGREEVVAGALGLVGAGRQPGAAKRLDRGDRHEGEGHAGREARRPVLAPADVLCWQAEKDGHLSGLRLLAPDFGKPRHLETRVRRLPPAMPHGANDEADRLLEDQADLLAAQQVRRLQRGDEHRRANRRVAGEGQLGGGREDARVRHVHRVARRQQEDRLRQVELARDGLHRGLVEVLGLADHGQRVAGERAGGEHVEDVVAPRHRGRLPREAPGVKATLGSVFVRGHENLDRDRPGGADLASDLERKTPPARQQVGRLRAGAEPRRVPPAIAPSLCWRRRGPLAATRRQSAIFETRRRRPGSRAPPCDRRPASPLVHPIDAQSPGPPRDGLRHYGSAESP